jgi:hypothetical protein
LAKISGVKCSPAVGAATDPETFAKFGLDPLDEAGTAKLMEELFPAQSANYRKCHYFPIE